MPHILGHNGGRDIDVVENVADIVKNPRGDFSHACLAGGFDELLVSALVPASERADDITIAPRE